MNDSLSDSLPALGPNGLRLITDPQFERIREHAVAFRRKGKDGRPLGWFAKIFDFLVTAKIPPEEKWLMCVLLHLGDRKSPTQKELAKIAKMRPCYVKAHLASLNKRGMVVFDKIRVNHMSEKTLIHITDPYYWCGVVSSYRIPHNPRIKPHTWVEQTLTEDNGRVNDTHSYSEEDYGYTESPRLLVEIDIPYKAKLVWLFIASISLFEHPTEQQISDAIGIDPVSARNYLRLLREKRMLHSVDIRFTHDKECPSRLVRIHHTVDVGLWDFEVAKSHYGCHSLKSILYTSKIIGDSATRETGSSQTGNGILTDVKRDPHRRETGSSQTGNGILTDVKRDPHGHSGPLANQGVQGEKSLCETSGGETGGCETGGWVKQEEATHPPVSINMQPLDPKNPELVVNLMAEMEKYLEPAFTERYPGSGKKHIPGPNSYQEINLRAAELVDAHGLEKMHAFGIWCQQLREKRGERVLLCNWDSLVKRWLSGESPEHPAVLEQMQQMAYYKSDEYREKLAKEKAEAEEQRKALEEDNAKKVMEAKAKREKILQADFDQFMTIATQSRKFRSSMTAQIVYLGGNMKAVLSFAAKDGEFETIFQETCAQLFGQEPDELILKIPRISKQAPITDFTIPF